MFRKKKFIVLLIIFTVLGTSSFLIIQKRYISDKFDKELFLSKKYSDKEILMFCDIGFLQNRIRKWETDIKVEIINIDSLNRREIDDIDSIIKILVPLIHPIKIERVENNGNLEVYRKVERIPSFSAHIRKNQPIGIVKMIPFTSTINFVEIYETKHAMGNNTIIHEFLHAIGLSHPSKPHKLHLVMSTSNTPPSFLTIEEYEAYKENNYYISEQEKQVIRMLYSSDVKSGLQKEDFIKEMELNY